MKTGHFNLLTTGNDAQGCFSGRSRGALSFVTFRDGRLFSAAFIAYAFSMRCVLGFDGGGTKTECVLMEETCRVRALTFSGASNPVNVGIEPAAAAMISAAREALLSSDLAPSDVTQVCAGVAGAGDPQIAFALETRLKKEFLNARVTLASDLQLSLQATRESPSVVVLAGTGSAAMGRDAKGNTARAGGMGPVIGDPGSAYETGRQAISLALQRYWSEEKFVLGEQLLASQQCSLSELADRARTHPTQMFPLIFREVAAAGEQGDLDARKLLSTAAEDLARLAEEVIGQLKLRGEKFFLGRTGGVFVGSPFLTQEFERSIQKTAPTGRVGPLPQSLAETAALLACEAARSESRQP